MTKACSLPTSARLRARTRRNPFVAGMMNYLHGVPQGERFFSQLRANGLLVNPTNGPTLAMLGSGQINIAFVQSSAAIGAALSDKSLKVRYLDPVTILPSAIGIDAKAPEQEQEQVEEFASYVLSAAGQKIMQSGDPTGDSLYYPVLDGVTPLKALPSLAGVSTQNIDRSPSASSRPSTPWRSACRASGQSARRFSQTSARRSG
ncbi:MAG: substrate-binding domain-containing protein [Acidimicrobiales bacterium]